MKISWKKNKKFKPDVLIQNINTNYKVDSKGKVVQPPFAYIEAEDALHGMLELPESIRRLNTARLFKKAVLSLVQKGELNKSTLLNEFKRLVVDELATKETQFYILTSISLDVQLAKNSYLLKGTNIELLPSEFPNKFNSRYGQVTHNCEHQPEPNNYTKVVIELKSKSYRVAATQALEMLHLLKAIWCLVANGDLEISSNTWKPINKVRLGYCHTIHDTTGEAIPNTYWFEPHFREEKLFKPFNPELFLEKTEFIVSQLDKHPYEQVLQNALLRADEALDEVDQNVALIKLWSALEILAAPNDSNCDHISKRCSFLFTERDYHQQIIEHLRSYRNSNVHIGQGQGDTRVRCFTLLRYFKKLIFFHLKHKNQFNSLDEANQFLDLPYDKRGLEKQKEMINKAIDFISE